MAYFQKFELADANEIGLDHLWTTREVGQYLGKGLDWVNKAVKSKGFPMPHVPAFMNQYASNLWRPEAVIAWTGEMLLAQAAKEQAKARSKNKEQPPIPEGIWSAREIAAYFGRNKTWVSELKKQSDFPSVIPGGQWSGGRWSKQEILDWAAQAGIQPKERKPDGEYSRRKTEGLCSKCGEAPRTEPYSWCQACTWASNQVQRERRESTHVPFTCIQCGAENLSNFKRCNKCRTENRAAPDGFCPCGNVLTEGYKTCAPCRDRRRDYYHALKKEALEAYGGMICACCKETEPGFLCLDHINGAGREERSGRGGSVRELSELRASGFPPGYQVLCENCNFGKRHRKCCPHQAPLELTARQREGWKLKAKVLNQYGGCKCACCHESRIEFLQIDHTSGGGEAHRREIGGGRHFYKWLKDNGYPEGYKVLCANCNQGKRKFGVCPHHTKWLAQAQTPVPSQS